MHIITNNSRVRDEVKKGEITFVDGDYLAVLRKTKEFIIDKHISLLTHPLSSSLKPNETYYKSIILSGNEHTSIDLESLEMIENAIEVTEKFLKNAKWPKWSEQSLSDFRLIDFDLINTALARMQIPPNFM